MSPSPPEPRAGTHLFRSNTIASHRLRRSMFFLFDDGTSWTRKIDHSYPSSIASPPLARACRISYQHTRHHLHSHLGQESSTLYHDTIACPGPFNEGVTSKLFYLTIFILCRLLYCCRSILPSNVDSEACQNSLGQPSTQQRWR